VGFSPENNSFPLDGEGQLEVKNGDVIPYYSPSPLPTPGDGELFQMHFSPDRSIRIDSFIKGAGIIETYLQFVRV